MSETTSDQCLTCGRPIVLNSWDGKCINCFSESERTGPASARIQLDVVCRALEPLDNDARSRVLRAAAVLFAIPGGLGGGR